MAISEREDPFYIALNHIAGLSGKLKNSIASASTARVSSDSSKELLISFGEVEQLTEDLARYADAVTLDVHNRAIPAAEISKRKSIVEEQRKKVKEFRTQIQGNARDRSISVASTSAQSSITNPYTPSTKTYASVNSTSSSAKQPSGYNAVKAQRENLMAKQDEHLGELAKSAERLHTTATTINKEIIDQQRLLSELDTDIDNEVVRMNSVMGGVSRLLRTSSKKKIYTVFVLLGLILLFILLLFIT